MTEITMRPVGMKLLFGAAVTLLLMSSVRQQWNSSKQKFARQVSQSSTQGPEEVQEGLEESNDGGDTGDRREEIVAHLEEDSLEGKLLIENNVQDDDITSKNQLAVSLIEQEELQEDTGNQGEIQKELQKDTGHQDEIQKELQENTVNQGDSQTPEYIRNVTETIGTNESTGDSPVSPTANLSTHTTFGNQGKITEEDTEETDSEIPDYDTSNDQDPDWRSLRFADALYDDEEEDQDKSEHDKLHVDFNVISENEKLSDKTYENSDENLVENTDNKQSSLFSWLGLGNSVSEGDKRGDASSEGILEGTHDNSNYDTNMINNKSTDLDNGTETSRNMTYGGIYTDVNKTTYDTNDSGNLQRETIKPQSNPINKELPFGVNGIDEANYDDLDDQMQTKDTEYKNDLDYAGESSQFDELQRDPDPERGFPDGRNYVPLADEDKPPSDDQVRETSPMDSSNFQKSDEIQHDQQQAHPLIYEPRQLPMLSNPPQRQLRPKLPIRPRILDILLANNPELWQSQQLLAKLRYYLHQNIHRIHQDIDPTSVNKTRSTLLRQLQPLASPQSNPLVSPQSNPLASPQSNPLVSPQSNPFVSSQRNPFVSTQSNPFVSSQSNHFVSTQSNAMVSSQSNPDNLLASKMSVTREFEKPEIPQKEDINSPETNNDVYNDNYGEAGTFYDTIHTNGDVNEADDNSGHKHSQANIYTPLPEPAIYDNPRPLSEKDFAMYRTPPFNTRLPVSESPVVEYHKEASDAVLEEQQTNTQNTKQEDESIPCPRQPHLLQTPQPVTALVGFSDSSTIWVRTMLEQLTGIQTDSIYNIMAQLKSGNAESVYNMGRKIVIETHMATEKNFDRAVVVIRNPFAVDARHRIFRPSSVEWQQIVLWNQTYSTWLKSSLPLHVMTIEDLMESPLTELMKLANFLSSPDMTISYKCAMKIALDPPIIINNVREITGIYHDDRRRINQNIDHVLQVALKRHPDILLRLNSYKVLPGT